jgi:hypothetical protein
MFVYCKRNEQSGLIWFRLGGLKIERDKEWGRTGKMSIMQWCKECCSQIIKVIEMERKVMK